MNVQTDTETDTHKHRLYNPLYVNYLSPVTSVTLALIRLAITTDLPSSSALRWKLTGFIGMLNFVSHTSSTCTCFAQGPFQILLQLFN